MVTVEKKKVPFLACGIIILSCMASPRSIFDFFAITPFPRFFDIILLVAFIYFILRGRLHLRSIYFLISFFCYLFLMATLGSQTDNHALVIGKIIQVAVFIFLFKELNLKFDENHVSFFLIFILWINVFFISYQVGTGNYFGVERAFETRAATFVEPAIAASGFTMSVLSLYFISRCRFVLFLLSFSCLLFIQSSAAILFTIVTMLFFYKKLIMKPRIILSFLAVSSVFFISIDLFEIINVDFKYISARFERLFFSEDFSLGPLLGKRYTVWADVIRLGEVSLFGQGFGRFGVLDNMYLRLLYEFGLVGLFIYIAFIVWGAFNRHHEMWVKSSFCCLAMFGLSHDIFFAVRVMELMCLLIIVNSQTGDVVYERNRAN